MGLARQIAELEERLLDKGDELLFTTEGRAALRSMPGFASAASAVHAAGITSSEQAVILCLQALRIHHTTTTPTMISAEFVATLPPGTPGIVRSTSQVVASMLENAQREVILLGYELTSESTLEALAVATSRGVSVIMICDRSRGSAARIVAEWPAAAPPPRVYHDRGNVAHAPYASMHAKCLLVDGEDLLITSANFTFHGMHGNIEIGVRLQGSSVTEARKLFSHLVETGVVEEYT